VSLVVWFSTLQRLRTATIKIQALFLHCLNLKLIAQRSFYISSTTSPTTKRYTREDMNHKDYGLSKRVTYLRNISRDNPKGSNRHRCWVFQWRTQYFKELYNVQSSPNIDKVIKPRLKEWAGRDLGAVDVVRRIILQRITNNEKGCERDSSGQILVR
jgi:transcription termination factor NusB